MRALTSTMDGAGVYSTDLTLQLLKLTEAEVRKAADELKEPDDSLTEAEARIAKSRKPSTTSRTKTTAWSRHRSA